MTEGPSRNMLVLEETMRPFNNIDVVAALADPETVDALREALGRLATPGMTTVMVGAEQGLTGNYEGIDGFLEAWSDWLGAFDYFHNQIESFIDPDPDTILALSRQRARTVTGGVEMDNEAAAIFRFEDGRLSRVEFHLDREAAARAAGVDPARLPG